MCTCPVLDKNHFRFIKAATNMKKPWWLNKQNFQAHLGRHHSGFRLVKKYDSKVKPKLKLEELELSKERMNQKMVLLFAKCNLSHLTIENSALKDILQCAIDIGSSHKDCRIDDIVKLKRASLKNNITVIATSLEKDLG